MEEEEELIEVSSDDFSSTDEDSHATVHQNLQSENPQSENLDPQSEDLSTQVPNLSVDVSRGIDELKLTGACATDHNVLAEPECDIRYWSTAVCV